MKRGRSSSDWDDVEEDKRLRRAVAGLFSSLPSRSPFRGPLIHALCPTLDEGYVQDRLGVRKASLNAGLRLKDLGGQAGRVH